MGNEDFPNIFQNAIKEDTKKEHNKKNDENKEENDLHIIGGGDPNLSPDAGKPLI